MEKKGVHSDMYRVHLLLVSVTHGPANIYYLHLYSKFFPLPDPTLFYFFSKSKTNKQKTAFPNKSKT
jgi:hypothetical protein